MTTRKHILSILVDNEPGVLSRIAGLFSGRGYNIDTLSVAQTMESKASRVIMETSGDDHIIEQIIKQLYKLINVITVVDLTQTRHVKRELALVKVHAKPEHRAEILRIVDIFRCRVVDVALDYYTIEISGNEEKLMAMMDLLTPMGIIETARTGSIALARGKITKRL